MENIKKEHITKLICAILSAITALTIFLSIGITGQSGTDLYDLSAGKLVLALILTPVLYKVCIHCINIYRERFVHVKSTVCIAAPAGLFAAFMVIGNAFVSDSTLRPIYDNGLQIAKSMFVFIGYFVIFFCGITWGFNYLDRADPCKVASKRYWKPVQMYLDSLSRRPFITALVTLLIVYIPYIVITYPALLMGDSPHQFWLVYKVYELNNAHPISHTLFLAFCLKAGYALFSSVNIGLFIYAILQFLFVITTISCLIKLLNHINVSEKISVFVLLYYMFHPRIQNYMFVVTKDVINAVFLLIFIVSLYMFFTKKHSVFLYVVLGISDLGAMLFRHDSFYLIFISLVVILFLIRNYRGQIVAIGACTLCFMLFWNSFLLPALNIPPNKSYQNPNGGLLGCMMVQQTARYLRDAGDQVTDEERAAISAFFDYDKLVANYSPTLSDGASAATKLEATQEDWKTYESAWLKMFFKHPEIYLEATLEHKYDYLYPHIAVGCTYAWSASRMAAINDSILAMPAELSYPNGLGDAKWGYQTLRESIFNIPILNIPLITATCFWTLFTWLAYCIYRNKKTGIAIMMPLLVLALILIAGPCNARYFRYMYPYVLCLPIVITLGLLPDRAEEKTDKVL